MREKNLFKFDSEDYDVIRDISDRKADDGDLTGALSVLFLALKKDKYNGYLMRDIADIYSEMGLYEMAVNFWFKCLNTQSKLLQSTAYAGLCEDFYFLGDLTTSGYYVQKQIISGGEDVEFDERFLEHLQNSYDANSQYKLSYPPESVDYENLLDTVRRLIKAEDFTGAIRRLEEIPENSPYKEEATLLLSVCFYFLGEPDKAEELSKEVLKANPSNIQAICNLASIAYVKKDERAHGYYLDMLKGLTPVDSMDRIKLATTYCECEMHEEAAENLSKLLEEKPYDATLIYLLAVAYFNMGRIERSGELFKEISLIYPDNPIPSIIWEYAKKKSLGKRAFSLKYSMEIPSVRYKALEKELKELSKMTKEEMVSSYETGENLVNAVKWCFYINNFAMKVSAADILIRSGFKEGEEEISDILVDCTADYRLKEEIIKRLVLKGGLRSVGVVLFNIYSRVRIKGADMTGKYSALFNQAYSEACARLLTICDHKFYMGELHAAATNLYYKFEMAAKIAELKIDINMLAAAIYIESGLAQDFNTLKKASAIFGVSREKLKKFMAMIKAL